MREERILSVKRQQSRAGAGLAVCTGVALVELLIDE